MIKWDNCQVTPPSLLSHVSSDDLKSCQQFILPTFPCHSQAVKWTINDVSASSSKVYGYKSRHDIVLLDKKARLELPKVAPRLISNNKNTFIT